MTCVLCKRLASPPQLKSFMSIMKSVDYIELINCFKTFDDDSRFCYTNFVYRRSSGTREPYNRKPRKRTSFSRISAVPGFQLITRRSQLQVLPPLLNKQKALLMGAFCVLTILLCYTSIVSLMGYNNAPQKSGLTQRAPDQWNSARFLAVCGAWSWFRSQSSTNRIPKQPSRTI